MTPRPDYDSPAGHGEWDALAVGWAMSALDPADEAIFLPHLADCDQCARTVAETTETVGELAWTVPDEAPPVELRSRLMTAVYSEPRGRSAGLPPAPSRPAGPAPPRSAPPPGPLAPPPPPADDAPHRGRHAAPDVVVPFRRRVTRDWRLLTAAATVLAVVLGLGTWYVALRGTESERLAAQRDAIVADLSRSGGRVIVLDSPAGQRLATMVVKSNEIDVVPENRELPPLGDNGAYWLWATTGPNDPSPSPLGGFNPTRNDVPFPVIRVDPTGVGRPDLDSITAFALSRERAPGVPTKPGEPVAAGQSN
jgi:anti-sigma factor RsiW